MINKDGEYESFYPNDVDRITQKAGTVSDSEKLTTFIALFIMCNVGLGMILPQFVVKMGGNVFLAILIQLLLNAVFGTTIFRFFVFKENDRVKEYKSYGQDSFSRYFKIGKEPVMEINVEGYGTVDVFGFTDTGMYMVALHLRYGSNNSEKDKKTKEALQDIFKVLCRANLAYTVVYSDEDFLESLEFKNYIKKINKGVYKDNMLRIFNYAMEVSGRSNVTATTILISTLRKHQIYELGVTLSNILTIANSNFNAFRSAEYLNFNQFVEFARDYYGLEVIDLSMVKTVAGGKHVLSDYLDRVNVYKIKTNRSRYKNSSVVDDKIVTMSKEVRKH